MMYRFQSALDELVDIASPYSIHEVGCGEGHHTINWLKTVIKLKALIFLKK